MGGAGTADGVTFSTLTVETLYSGHLELSSALEDSNTFTSVSGK
jgi:hypothetical protein